MRVNAPDDEHGGVLTELVLLAAGLKVDLPADGVAQVDLAVEHVGERGRVRVCSPYQHCGAYTEAARTHLQSPP